MKKKSLVTVLLAGLMVASLTGCGGKASSYKKYVTLGEYKGIEYSQDVAEVTKDDIQAEVDTFLNGLTESEEVTDRAVEDGDTLNIDFVGKVDGKEFDGGTAEGQTLVIGSNTYIDGFEKGLIGHNIGEKVSLDLTFPEDYSTEDLAGKDVTFDVTINSISVDKKPEYTDKLVKDNTDYDTIKAYEASIKEDLEEKNKQNAEQQAESDIFEKVVAACEITGYDENEVKSLVDEEFENFQKTAESYQQYGYTYDDILSSYGYTSEDGLKEGITEYVKGYLDQKMVLYCIADAENIKVTSDEIEAKVKEYMDSYGVTDEKEVYDQVGEEYFEISILSEKVMKFLKENAVLVEGKKDADDSKDKDAKTEESKKDDSKDKKEDKDTEEKTTEEKTTEADKDDK